MVNSNNYFELTGKVHSVRSAPSGKAWFVTLVVGKKKPEYQQIIFFDNPYIEQDQEVTITGMLGVKDINYNHKYDMPSYLSNQTNLIGQDVKDPDGNTKHNIYGGVEQENLDFGFDKPVSEVFKKDK